MVGEQAVDDNDSRRSRYRVGLGAVWNCASGFNIWWFGVGLTTRPGKEKKKTDSSQASWRPFF